MNRNVRATIALLSTALVLAPGAIAPAIAHDGGPPLVVAQADATPAVHEHLAVDNPLAAHVRDANARFADPAVALAEGYAPIPCVSGIEGGAMGIHYVNGDLIADGVIDIARPEAVMYEPKPDGTLELIAVEYITHQGPAALEGHLFAFNGAPNRYGLDPFYELHVWAWRGNPTGTFADMNPAVSCDAATAPAN